LKCSSSALAAKTSGCDGEQSRTYPAGYDGWADLLLKQPNDKSSSQEFKTVRRKEIEYAGFTIIFNVGDQYSDLRGGHAERVFKVPNPFYFIP
jgi:HAD superfamily, subfamily IIIB (Acid phosphatase)